MKAKRSARGAILSGMEQPIDPKAFPALQVLEETPHILHALIRCVSDDIVEWKPAADRWSIREVLVHLIDVENRGFRSRAEAMLLSDDPELPAYDQIAALKGALTTYASASKDQLLHTFEQERGEMLRFILRVPATSLERSGRHEELGRITLRELVNEWAFHDLGHVRQIAELYRSRAFYPQMGGFQKYYRINP